MRWLDRPQNDVERQLREGLDQATRRTGDEIMHRRVWAKVFESIESPPPRRYARLVYVSVAIVLVAGAGLVSLPKLLDMVGTQSTPEGRLTDTTGSAPTKASPAPAIATASPEQTVETERLPGQVVRTRAGERARVALGGGANAELRENSAITWDSQHRPSIENGAALLSVPHQPPGWRFSVTAGPYVVTVVGTKFEVRVDESTVGVDVTEGVVEVWHGSQSTRLVAGDSWRGPSVLDEATSTTSAPAERPRALASHRRAKLAKAASKGLQDAQAALEAGDTNKAIDLLTRLAAGRGPAAENAAYELGRVTRYTLNRPRQAVALWNKYRSRFPSGLLRTEADLSIVDTLSSIGDTGAALAEAEAFLSRHPSSERKAEVQRLVERLRASETAAGAR